MGVFPVDDAEPPTFGRLIDVGNHESKAYSCVRCAGIAVSAFSGTPASAEMGVYWDIKFSSDVVRPGDMVDVIGMCVEKPLGERSVTSSILDAPDLRPVDLPDGWNLISHARVKDDATPEIWPVSFTCAGQMVTGYLRVEAADAPKPGSPRVAVVPAKGRVGEQVSVRANCPERPTVTSTALTMGNLEKVPEGRAPDLPLFVGVGTVKDVKPGAYKINAKCGAEKMSTTFTVIGNPEPAAKAQVPVKPKGAPETGEIVSQPVEDVSSPTALVLGGAGMLLASAGVGLWAYRRRRAG